MAESRLGLEAIRRALDSAGDPWEAGVTSVSSLSAEEKRKLLGVNPPPGELSIEEVAARAMETQESVKAEATEAVAAPSAYDLRSVGGGNFVTAIKNQKSCGSCVAFGTVATVESALRVQNGDPNLEVDLSEAQLFFCLGEDTGAGCNSGWWPHYAFDAFKNVGVVDEACYPYDSGLATQDCSGLCADWANRVLKITGYTDLTSNPARIKEWVSTSGPVSACFVVYDDFFNYTSGIYKHVTGGQAGGHCVTIVGYDDNPGYWICKNSWGTGWGEQGFFRIAYGECGIDTWQNHGVEGIEVTGWQSNRRVTGLWTIDEDCNAWAYFDALGWRKVSPDNETIFVDMLAQLVAAKAGGRSVTFFEEQNVIKQVYVF